MSTVSLSERLMKALELLKNEIKRYKLQEKIRTDVEEKLKEGNKKFFLEQELKHIKKELGMEKDSKSELIKKWKKLMEKYDIPKEVLDVINEEISKFETLEP